MADKSKNKVEVINLSDEDLRAQANTFIKEIERRRQAKIDVEINLNKERFDSLQKLLTKPLIDLLTPEHNERTKCSDQSPGIGILEDESEEVCSRCALIQFMSIGSAECPPDGVVDIKLDFKFSKSR